MQEYMYFACSIYKTYFFYRNMTLKYNIYIEMFSLKCYNFEEKI